MNDGPSSSDLSLTKKVWRGIWNLRIPNRVKSLLWRVGSKALPTRVNLRKRKILTDDSCPHCNLDKETSFHALWSCSCLYPVWKVHFSWLTKLAMKCTSLLDVIQLSQDHNNLMELFALTVALIWAGSNQIRIGEKALPIEKINSTALENLQEFQLASSTPHCAPPTIKPAKWSPPPPSWMKVNFDGATFSSKGLASLGAIIRNDQGLVMAAYKHPIPLPTSVETMKVLATHSAIYLARDLNFNKVIFEGNSEIIIKAINKGDLVSSSFGHILKDINLLSKTFHKVSFCHTHRQGNRAAHGLARMACNFSAYQVWMEDVPPDLSAVYCSDFPE